MTDTTETTNQKNESDGDANVGVDGVVMPEILKDNAKYVIHAFIGIGVVMGKWAEVEIAANLTGAVIVVFFFLAVIAAFNADDLFKKKSPTMDIKLHTLYGIVCVLLFAAGWFWLGGFYLLSVLIIVGLKMAKIEKMKSAAESK